MKKLFFISLLLLCGLGLVRLDRHFLKKNGGFCLHHVVTKLPYRAEWEAEFPKEAALPLLEQKFYYLGKGHQSYVFESADGQVVLKFYRFPSHLRLFPWLKHPFSYAWSAKRQEIKAYNLQKLSDTFSSYRMAFQELREDCGLIAVHLNRSEDLRTFVVIVDQLGQEYAVDLDEVVFLLQKKAERIFPRWENQDSLGKQRMAGEISQLIQRRCEKGIVDQDAILEKNYGWLGDRAIHIDVGRFAKVEELSTEEEVRRITECLKN
jgi:hypothetical protein